MFQFRFEEKNNTIEQLESQLRKLHHSTESLVMYRKDLGYATNNMGKAMAILSVSEENSALSAAIAQLSSVHEKISSIHHDQASVEFYELSELIKDYLGLVGAVKDVFHVSFSVYSHTNVLTFLLLVFKLNTDFEFTQYFSTHVLF